MLIFVGELTEKLTGSVRNRALDIIMNALVWVGFEGLALSANIMR